MCAFIYTHDNCVYTVYIYYAYINAHTNIYMHQDIYIYINMHIDHFYIHIFYKYIWMCAFIYRQ